MSKDLFRSIEHLDLTDRVEQTEDRPRFAGGFGKIYYGKLSSDSGVVNVAIKRVSISGDQNFADTVKKELKIWSRLDHQNVLKLRGYTLDDAKFPALVSEYMENGTMLNYLKLHPQVDILEMVNGVAEGLAYLHKEGVIHADLKSDNVLISPSGAPLLTDFGISRMLIVTHTVTVLKDLIGSVRWMAYELIAPHCQLPSNVDTTTITEMKPTVPSKETDVWAFGMVVYEILTKQHPFAGYLDVQAIAAIAMGRLPAPPSNLQSLGTIETSLWDLCTRCWDRDTTSRPVMTDVVREINGRSFVSWISLDSFPRD
ncbi:kinase-like protein [Rickenella mellea]|uniref:Kinase-like protein n=1 Tax=Rickenella mellea TaxID=50990 RepID=A0A4Y7PM02_9AGAM|nr:kinase-like protein [Rickenella mellea]